MIGRPKGRPRRGCVLKDACARASFRTWPAAEAGLQPVQSPVASAPLAGFVPRWLALPGGVIGVERTVRVTPDRIKHIRQRRPGWLEFCLKHIPDALGDPDFVGLRAQGDQRRIELVRLVGRPARWLLVSVKFLDDVREAWVNSAHPIATSYLTRRRRAGTMWQARGP